jgi:outer membrane receptor protein involved in Fe transport
MRPTESLFKKDSLSNFTYNYKENINSFYGNFAQQLGKFKYQIGSRIENSSQIPNLVSENKTYSRTYFNLFPSAFLTYSFTKENEITMSYSKRINRPSSETLNPFTSYSDPYNLRRGNPEVSPEFIDSYELGYVLSKKKISLSMNVYYRATNNVLQRFRSYDSSGYSAVTYTNIDRSESVGAEWVVTYRPIPLFRNVLSFNANHINYFDANTTLQMNNGVYWSMKYIGAFEFWKRTASIQINAKYNAPIVTVQGTVQPRPSIDLSTEKQFKEGKWVIGLRLSDVFNTQEFRIHVDQPTVQQTSVFKQTTRRVYLNLSYKFGRMDVVKKSKIANEQGGGGGDF